MSSRFTANCVQICDADGGKRHHFTVCQSPSSTNINLTDTESSIGWKTFKSINEYITTWTTWNCSLVHKHRYHYRVSAQAVPHDKTYHILFLTIFYFLMIPEPINDDPKNVFHTCAHRHRSSFALLTFWWWRHNWLRNAANDVTIDSVVVARASAKWYLVS